jgi:hypothetical protein
MSRKFIVLAMLVILTMIFAACAPAAPAEPGAADAPAAEAPAAEAPAAEDPAAEPTPVVNAFGTCDDPLRLWHGLTGSDGAVFAEMLTMFSEANPDLCFESQAFRGISSSRSTPRLLQQVRRPI